MGMPAARITDLHVCPLSDGPKPHVGGPISGPCAPLVLTGGLPQARVTDMAVCVGPPDMIVMGAMTVLVNGLPAARLGDMTAHGGKIVSGFPTVLIGDFGGGGFSGGGGPVVLPMGVESPGASPDPAAKAMIAAAKSGTPFVEPCRS